MLWSRCVFVNWDRAPRLRVGAPCQLSHLCRRRTYLDVHTVCGVGSGRERIFEHLGTGLQSRDIRKLTFTFSHECYGGGVLCSVVCMRQSWHELHHQTSTLQSAALNNIFNDTQLFATIGHWCRCRYTTSKLWVPWSRRCSYCWCWPSMSRAHMFPAVDASIISMTLYCIFQPGGVGASIIATI